MAREFRLPDLGEGITEAQIVQVLVTEGETIEEDRNLFEVETDKAAVEIPSPYAGPIERLHIVAGQMVRVGDVMVTFGGDDSADPTAAKKLKKVADSPAVVTATTATTTTTAKPSPTSARRTRAAAAPAVRKLARDSGIDIDIIAGSGPGGRVTRADVQAAVNGPSAAASAPAPPPSKRAPAPPPAALPAGERGNDQWGATRTVPITQIRKTIAQQMTRSISTAAHVTQMDMADVTNLESLRKQYRDAHNGERRITAMAFVVNAVAKALRNHPIFNANIDTQAGTITYKEYINVGIAVDTPRGLVVPSIRGADALGVAQIAAELGGISEKAREARFAVDDLRGGTFTITNVGALGGTYSTPIINYPEVAILGMGRAKEMPAVKDGAIVIRTMMPVSFSFDHRIADGAQAARFCKELLAYLEHPVTLFI